MFLRFLKISFWAGLCCIALSGGAVAAIYYSALDELPDVSELKNVTFETPMQVYSRDGKLIGEFGEHKRIPVKLDDIPEKLKQAFIATEDSRFYEHNGIDPIGIARAVVVAISNAQATQGASTITQQVARNFFLTREKTIKRKLKEIFISLRIEQILTKDEIFELYLNKIALSHRAYGVAAAAQIYYGKDLKDLTLGQMATIAGLPKAPSTFNPISHPEKSRERRQVVLSRMLTMGFITKEEYDKANAEPYKAYFHETPIDLYAPYVAEEARNFAITNYGEEAYINGTKIYTSINAKDQEAANKALFKGVTEYDTRHGYRGPILNIKDIKDENFSVADLLIKYDDYYFIKPALVLEVLDKENIAKVLHRDGYTYDLTWDNIKWARKFISDERQGKIPKKVSEVLTKGDLIYTYVNDKNELTLTQLPEVDAALVAINPHSGSIEAMVGGYDFKKSQLNHTTQALRQTGSNFKTFLYSAAVAKNIAINSAFQDLPIKTWDPGSQTWWEPRNSPNRFDGIMTLREAISRSKNSVTIRLARQVGIQNFVTHLKKFNIEVAKNQQSEAMALGSVEQTPLTMATAYATFANGGYLLSPYLILKAEANGQELFNKEEFYLDSTKLEDGVINDIELKYKDGFDPNSTPAPQILSHAHAFIVADLLSSVVYGGKGIQRAYAGTAYRLPSIVQRKDLHGKTGTTNKSHDAWFSGFNGNLVAATWIGFDDSRNLGYVPGVMGEGGSTSAMPIFAYFMKDALKGEDEAFIPKPNDVYRSTANGISDWVLKDVTVINEGSGSFNSNDNGNSSDGSLDELFDNDININQNNTPVSNRTVDSKENTIVYDDSSDEPYSNSTMTQNQTNENAPIKDPSNNEEGVLDIF